MLHGLALLAARLRQLHDQELAQAFTRAIMTLGIAALCALRAALGHDPAFHDLAIAIGAYFAYALAHFAWVAARPGKFEARRMIGIVGDQAACTAAFVILGDRAFIFFVVYIWTGVGNGMRFGSRYMAAATAFAAIGFAVAVILRDLAATHLDTVVGVFATIVAIPLFVRKLFARLEAAHEALQAQAMQLQHDATHDRLTGLANRAVFFDRLDRIIARAARHRVQCAVIYFDIDRFKTINDSYGHAAGDAWLRQVAHAIGQGIRKDDTFCRLAGDEFVIIAEDVRAEQAMRIAESIHGAVRSVDAVAGHEISVTASIGIALYPGSDPHEDAHALVNRADLAMYCSKQQGRARTTVHADGQAANHTIVPLAHMRAANA